MGPGVTLVDPAMTAAHHLERMLAERGLRASHENGQAHFYVCLLYTSCGVVKCFFEFSDKIFLSPVNRQQKNIRNSN